MLRGLAQLTTRAMARFCSRSCTRLPGLKPGIQAISIAPRPHVQARDMDLVSAPIILSVVSSRRTVIWVKRQENELFLSGLLTSLWHKYGSACLAPWKLQVIRSGLLAVQSREK